jgi:signal transduction histidine kinase
MPKPAETVHAMVEDAAGDVWVSTNRTPLARITRDDRVIDESPRIASVHRPIRVLHATPDGCVWMGFDQGGVGRLKDGFFGCITTRQGLTGDNIELVLSDGRGWLWIAGNGAIVKVREDEIAAVIERRAQRVRPVRYGHDHGVRPVFGASVGALRRRDGRLWVPMATSLAIIDPSQQRPVAGPPPVWITAVKVDEQLVAAHHGALPLGKEAAAENAVLRFPPDHRRLDIEFTALSFRMPSNVQFRYRLDGFDDRWVEAGGQRSASYPQLPAGDYRFHVVACNSEGIWNETGAAFAFSVEPFFWATWWFRIIAFTGFTASVFGIARYVSHRRLRQKLREAEKETAVERERARIARDIHDDLGSRLTKIILLSGLVARDRVAPEKASERVWEISETARQLLNSLDETVWVVNPRNDTLPNFIAYIGEFTVNFLRTAEVLCHVDLPASPPERPLSADVRHNLFLVIKETLNNVVRHAQASAAWLRVTVTDHALLVAVEDNGRGFSPGPDKPEADGLRNMRERMAQIGGQFHIESKPGEGTRVSLTFPWSARS